MSQSGHVTVILVCTLAQAQTHLEKHLPGATTKEVGHYLAIQHPDLDAMGTAGAESLCYLNTLPMRTVAMRPAL
jgi:hypothetical protein